MTSVTEAKRCLQQSCRLNGEEYQWRPGASQDARIARAKLYATIRDYFAKQQVLEVETPLLGHAGVTATQIENITAGDYYLQTSPEYAMKRLLAAGSGSIYQICKAFRGAEVGSRHNPEFTMLEWYREGFDHRELMRDVQSLLRAVGVLLPTSFHSYQEIFQKHLGIDPLCCSLGDVQECLQKHDVDLPTGDMDRDAYLDLCMVSLLEPAFPKDEVLFIYDYPASQAALARLNVDDPRVAHRFECYLAGIEIANGFYELTDAKEQAARFAADNLLRTQNGIATVPVDNALLAAPASGMPDCAGVALGVDRVLMHLLGAKTLDEVIDFAWGRC